MNKPPVQVSSTIEAGQRVVVLTLDMPIERPRCDLTVIQTLSLEDAGELACAIARQIAACVAASTADLERETEEAVGAAVLVAEALRGSHWLSDG